MLVFFKGISLKSSDGRVGGGVGCGSGGSSKCRLSSLRDLVIEVNIGHYYILLSKVAHG